MQQDLDTFVRNMPKAELHVHLEGTLTPGLCLELARRNGADFPYKSVDEILAARNYDAPTAVEYLQKFLEHYFSSLVVLVTEDDFRDATYDFLKRSAEENVIYVELSFDPQAHTVRDIDFATVINGIDAGRRAAEAEFDLRCGLIMCINRDRSAESAEQMIRQAKPYQYLISGLGLDSVEEGNPPTKFERAYAMARDEGYNLTAHCDVDQNNAVKHMWQCLDLLHVSRIDHGLNALDDPNLIEELIAREICLTGCPTWRPQDSGPRRVDRIKRMDELGLRVTVNTDDPGLFTSGTMNTMLPAVARAGGFATGDMVRLMENAFRGAWISPADRRAFLDRLKGYEQAAEQMID